MHLRLHESTCSQEQRDSLVCAYTAFHRPREMIRLWQADNCVHRCSCPARNASSLSDYPHPPTLTASHPSRLPPSPFRTLTTFLSTPVPSAPLLQDPAQESISALDPESKSVPPRPPAPLLGLFAQQKKAAKRGFGIWMNEQIKVQQARLPKRADSLRTLSRESSAHSGHHLWFQWAHCSYTGGGAGAGRTLMYQFIIGLIVSEISIRALLKAQRRALHLGVILTCLQRIMSKRYW